MAETGTEEELTDGQVVAVAQPFHDGTLRRRQNGFFNLQDVNNRNGEVQGSARNGGGLQPGDFSGENIASDSAGGVQDGTVGEGAVVEVFDGNDGGLPGLDELLDGGGAEGGEGLEVGEEVPIIVDGGAAGEGQDVGEEESVEVGDDFAFVPGDEAPVGEGAGACEPV